MSDAKSISPKPREDRDRSDDRESAMASIVELFLEQQAEIEKLDAEMTDSTALGDTTRPGPSAWNRILLVCGSRRKCTRLGLWLKRPGLDLDSRPNLDAAVHSVVADRPTVVVAPWHLKDRQGRRVIEAIRNIATTHPPLIIVLCRHTRAARAAIEAGADDVIPRPFDARIVASRIEKVIDQARKEAELRRLRSELRESRQYATEPEPERRRHEAPDDLTGLPNQLALERTLRGALTAGASPRRRTALALFDIDRFRNIDHSLGRSLANVVLQEFAQRLVRALDPDRLESGASASTVTAMAARVAGDQFAILLSGIPEELDLGASIRQIQRRLTDDYELVSGDRVHLTVSVGVSVAPDDCASAQGLLQYAEYALEESADVGGGVVRFFGSSSNPWTERHARMANLLVGALGRGELTIHYQPIVEAGTGRVVAAEALLRWRSPELGDVPPGEFVPIAEERGLMVRIGAWVLGEACRRLRAWLDEGLGPIRIAVNVSIGQLVQERFSDTVRSILRTHGIDPELLELEISERGVLRDDPAVMEQFRELRRMGCRLAIDDFGTGNSAVAYLKRFPLTTLKIDRSFVSGIVDSEEDSAITTAITAMAHQLRLTVVAEGVETQEQRRFLERCGCAELQGFLFSRAVDAAHFRELLGRAHDDEQSSAG